MPVRVDISEEALKRAGYVNLRDASDLRQLGLVAIERLNDIRLSINEVSTWLKIGNGRLRRYFKVKNIHLAADGKMSLADVLLADWSELKDLNRPGDGLRKATHFYDKGI